jgi:hypothetical protein
MIRNIPKSSGILLLSIIIILLCGIWARYYNLEDHFTHVDDIIIAEVILKKKKSVKEDSTIEYKAVSACFQSAHTISRRLTYAPFQFWITPWLIDQDQNYREVLFWGRFPSFIFGVLGLIMMLVFYYRFKPDNPFPYQLLSLSILAFSWENIIYSNQMESYSIGIVSILILMLMSFHFIEKPRLSWLSMILLALFPALLVHSQYQMLFFIPAFYLTLFLFHYKKSIDSPLILIGKFFFSGIAFILLNWPMYHNYLRHHTEGGINWNAGPGQMFLFRLNSVEGIISKLFYSFDFFISNFITVFQSEIAFLSEENKIFNILSYFLLILFLSGVISFLFSSDQKKKWLGIFFGLSSLTWFTLVILQKITLSPTRHSLILLPLFAICISEGLCFLIEKMSRKNDNIIKHTGWASLAFTLIISALFFSSFKAISHEREDEFNEKEMEAFLEKYDPDMIVQYFFTYNMSIMKNVRDKYFVFEGDRWYIEPPLCDSMNTLAFVSARIPYPSAYFSSKKGMMNDQRELILANSSEADFKMIYKKELTSDVEIDFSRKTKNGNNSLFLYIFKRIKP